MSRELSTLMREFLEPAVVEVEPDISIFGSAIVHVPIQAQQDTWEVVDSPKRLIKDFEFSEFSRMVDFLAELLEYQEEVNHHAKITTDYRTVRVESYTHDVDDVTELDIEYAQYADGLWMDVVSEQ